MDRGRSEEKLFNSGCSRQSNPTRKRVCDALRSGSGDDPPGIDKSAKGYVRRGQSLAVRDDQKVMDAPGTNAAGAEKAEHLTV